MRALRGALGQLVADTTQAPRDSRTNQHRPMTHLPGWRELRPDNETERTHHV